MEKYSHAHTSVLIPLNSDYGYAIHFIRLGRSSPRYPTEQRNRNDRLRNDIRSMHSKPEIVYSTIGNKLHFIEAIVSDRLKYKYYSKGKLSRFFRPIELCCLREQLAAKIEFSIHHFITSSLNRK